MIYFLNGGRKQINFIPSLWGLMHKNTYANVPTLSAIAISAILLTSFTMVGMQLSQHALAQNTTSATPTNATSAGPTNATSAGPRTNNTASQTPTVGQSFVWQGTKSSQISPLPGHANEYVAAVLIPRSDSAVYSGVLKFTASSAVNVEVWNIVDKNTAGMVSYNGLPIIFTDMSPPNTSASVPFSANAVLLKSTSPFTMTYTVNAIVR